MLNDKPNADRPVFSMRLLLIPALAFVTGAVSFGENANSAARQKDQTEQASPSKSGTKRKAKPDPRLNELRERYNQLTVRAETAKSGLASLKKQMAEQGSSLRTDIIEAESRMDYLLDEAKDAILGRDIDAATKNLDQAELSIQTIEKFLGR